MNRKPRITELVAQAREAGRGYALAVKATGEQPHSVPLSVEDTRGLISGVLEIDPDSLNSVDTFKISQAYTNGYFGD